MGVIFNFWASVPVYHLISATKSEGHSWFDVTLCNRRVYDGRSWVPLKHLLKFARLCRDCERNQRG